LVIPFFPKIPQYLWSLEWIGISLCLKSSLKLWLYSLSPRKEGHLLSREG
jgi:hypothetical protein